jgi:hypothetical protein
MSEDLKPDHLEVVEEKDGSASVELPDNVDNPQIEARDAQDADGDVDHPDDTDAQREARRNRRRAKKDYIKRTNEEKDSRLTNLQRQNQELMERLAVVERKSYASDLARLDKAMEDEELRLNYATAKMREATDSANGMAFTQAQQMWYESKRKIEAMEGFKQRAVSAGDKEEGAANPQLVRQANRWMERNSWYDPKGGDEDSQIAKVIDNRLAEEGYDPASSDYWEELDSRLQKRLPHLYNQRSESNRSRPRSVVTGTGRETGRASGGNTFVLEPEQVRAMKDAGLWDDPEKRARMIKRYAAEAKLNRNA